MPYPKHVVTYCVITVEAGGNPFWHSMILMSVQTAEDKPIKVMNAFGFYSTYPSSTTNPIIKFIKDILGFKIDLQDSHGHLDTEKLRYLDGQGLRGISFDVTEEKHTELLEGYQKARILEQQAIGEYDEILRAEGMPVNGHTRWMKEKQLVSEKRSIQRLFPFHIDWGFSWNFNDFGFFTNKSYTCKSRALDLLRAVDIVDDKFVNKIKGSPAASAFPRYGSLDLPPIQLVSTGKRAKQEIKDGTGKIKVHYNHTWENDNQLFWAHAPRMHAAEASIDDLQKQDDEYNLVRNMSKHIDEVELLLLKRIDSYKSDNSGTSSHCAQCQTQLKRIMDIRDSLKTNNKNQLGSSLASRLFFAEKTLNTARMTLTPEKIDYNFLDRAIQNIALRDALLGLIAIIAAANMLTGIAVIAVTIGAAVYSGYKFYKAIETELETLEMMGDYKKFHAHDATASPTQRCDSPSRDNLGVVHSPLGSL